MKNLTILTGACVCLLTACSPPEVNDALVLDAHQLPETQLAPPQAECDARWLPSACTEQVASSQWINYQSAAGCSGGPQPGAQDLSAFIQAAFPNVAGVGIYNCRSIQGGSAWSLHAEGRALDIMIPLDPAQPYGANNAIGDPVAAWLMEHAQEIGIQSFSWDRTIFYGNEAFPKHHCLSIANGHWDHLHVELTWDAANRLTPWFQAPPAEPAQASAVSNPSLPSMSRLGEPAGIEVLSTPRRLFDTRTSSTDVLRGNGTRSGPLTGAGINTLDRWSSSGVGNHVDALWLNLAAVPGTQPGYLAAYPAAEPVPATSSVNYGCQEVRSNATPVARGSNLDISIDATHDVDAIADLFATFQEDGDGFVEVTPTRLVDTRDTTLLRAGQTLTVPVTCPSSADDCAQVTGAMATVAAISQGTRGYITAHRCGTTAPTVSNINYLESGVVPNTVLAPVSNGRFCLTSSADVHLIVDLTGVITPTGSSAFQPLSPRRLLDTRQTNTPWRGRLAAGQTITLPIQTLSNMPSYTRAVTVNIANVNTDANGYITAYPCDISRPTISSHNMVGGKVSSTLATVNTGSTGQICLYSLVRTDLIVDVVGAWVERDTDADGAYDFQETCDVDPGKSSPGVCGCGTPDVDSDGDASMDCVDACPADGGKVSPGVCGCGTPDVDSDGDATLDCQDVCPTDPTKIALGVCGCGTPDTDTDGDLTADCIDSCPADPDKIAPGACGCGLPDEDLDGDGTADCTVCGDGIVGVGESCDDGGTLWGDGCDETCTVETLLFTSMTPSVAGVVNTLRASQGVPGTDVWFVAGSFFGSSQVPGCPGLTLPVARPTILGSATVQSSGAAELDIFAPARHRGFGALFFAVDLGTCRASVGEYYELQ